MKGVEIQIDVELMEELDRQARAGNTAITVTATKDINLVISIDDEEAVRAELKSISLNGLLLPALAQALERTGNDGRCRATCVVRGTDEKRCMRPLNHPIVYDHMWVEALNRVDGFPELVTWQGDHASEPAVSAAVAVRSRV